MKNKRKMSEGSEFHTEGTVTPKLWSNVADIDDICLIKIPYILFIINCH